MDAKIDIDVDPPPVHFDAEIYIDIDPPPVHSDAEINIDIDDEAPRQPSPQHPHARSYNIQRLPPDPGERIPISDYDVNGQDEVRRWYIAKNAVQPYAHNFEVKKMYGKNRHFNFVWFENYKWLEYSVKYEAAFCFVCYLFKGKSNGGPKGDAFVKGGWKNWYKPDALDKHEGGINSIHNKAQEKYNLFVAPQPSIDNIMVRVSKDDLRMYKARLTYSLRCLRFLLNQGLAFRGHDESEESSNRGNFIELLKWLSENDEEVNKLVLNNAPGNCILTSPKIQNQIIECCEVQTTKRIIEDIGDDHYAILLMSLVMHLIKNNLLSAYDLLTNREEDVRGSLELFMLPIQLHCHLRMQFKLCLKIII